ncbi:MAG: universal stress protein [Nitrospirota bacterium]|nr:universal stress protein [Nitrospirota bacterium]
MISVIQKSATKESIQRHENALNKIKSNAEEESIKVDTALVKSRPPESIHEAIIEYAKEKKADIIVMGSHGRTGIKRLLMGSVAERVIGHTTSSVLVVKP